MKNTLLRLTLALAATQPLASAQAQYLADNRVPKPAEELYRAGERAYRGGDHATAILLFSQVLELEPEHVNAFLNRGLRRPSLISIA
ncbi:MAG: hypothetical protein IPJ85_17510 [Flavobacteriales bacterium]|nr:hypothetical protein [Flavobacteriales bacterium]